MKVSRTMAYAVQAMLRLARSQPGIPVPCRQLAREGRMPERFLLQILRNLVTHDVLVSTRGVDGGYSLARPPEEISLMDIFEALDNPLLASVPPLEGLSDDVRQKLLAALNRVSAAARQELSKLSLADLLGRTPVEKN